MYYIITNIFYPFYALFFLIYLCMNCQTYKNVIPMELSHIVGRSFTFKVKLTDYNLDKGKESFTVAEICDEEFTNYNRHNELRSAWMSQIGKGTSTSETGGRNYRKHRRVSQLSGTWEIRPSKAYVVERQDGTKLGENRMSGAPRAKTQIEGAFVVGSALEIDQPSERYIAIESGQPRVWKTPLVCHCSGADRFTTLAPLSDIADEFVHRQLRLSSLASSYQLQHNIEAHKTFKMGKQLNTKQKVNNECTITDHFTSTTINSNQQLQILRSINSSLHGHHNQLKLADTSTY
ncbi:hypothetical protein Scep_027659 [Stephania cephalantha]|uniref:Uncharacterized protein n=1 Tax=Stephania cephalantha TaxID=152367 RepID=A0AAP0ECZ7_9MAGN